MQCARTLICEDKTGFEAYLCLKEIGLPRDILWLVVPLLHSHSVWTDALKRVRLLQESRHERHRLGESEEQLDRGILSCCNLFSCLLARNCCARLTYDAELWNELNLFFEDGAVYSVEITFAALRTVGCAFDALQSFDAESISKLEIVPQMTRYVSSAYTKYRKDPHDFEIMGRLAGALHCAFDYTGRVFQFRAGDPRFRNGLRMEEAMRGSNLLCQFLEVLRRIYEMRHSQIPRETVMDDFVISEVVRLFADILTFLQARSFPLPQKYFDASIQIHCGSKRWGCEPSPESGFVLRNSHSAWSHSPARNRSAEHTIFLSSGKVCGSSFCEFPRDRRGWHCCEAQFPDIVCSFDFFGSLL